MKILSIVLLAVLATGCSQSNKSNSLILPPNTLCEPNEQLLICDSSSLLNCEGYLKDKDIIIEESEL